MTTLAPARPGLLPPGTHYVALGHLHRTHSEEAAVRMQRIQTLVNEIKSRRSQRI